MRARGILAALGILAAVAAAVALIATPASSTTQERSQSDPTGWWWYNNRTEAQVVDLINANGARIVDIEVEQISPSFLFSVAMVRNEGPYEKDWWWYYNPTPADLSANLSSNNARLIDLEAWDVNGEERFAAVMISNTGDQSKDWWWYDHATPASISDALAMNNARLIDIDTYFIFNVMTFNLERYYSAVMISNKGADQKAWWWYVNATPAFIAGELSTNNARLIDIELDDPAAGTYTGIMEACPCPAWWWYFNATEAQLNDAADQNGARIIDIETYEVSGDKRFAAVMIDNSTPPAGPAEPGETGDVDKDGDVDVFDALAILGALAGFEPLEFPDNGDVNGDGTTNIFDVLAVLAIVVSAP